MHLVLVLLMVLLSVGWADASVASSNPLIGRRWIVTYDQAAEDAVIAAVVQRMGAQLKGNPTPTASQRKMLVFEGSSSLPFATTNALRSLPGKRIRSVASIKYGLSTWMFWLHPVRAPAVQHRLHGLGAAMHISARHAACRMGAACPVPVRDSARRPCPAPSAVLCVALAYAPAPL